MLTIHKFQVHADAFHHEMPADARVLKVMGQYESIQMWVLLDPNAPKVRRRFQVFGTGFEIPPNIGPYVDSFMELSGRLVWHLFELDQKTAVSDG